MRKLYLMACLIIIAGVSFAEKSFALTSLVAHEGMTRASAPIINTISPASGPIGTVVTITGTNLDNLNELVIGNAIAAPQSNTGTVLIGVVMPGATSGTVKVTTSSGVTIAAQTFSVTGSSYPAATQGGRFVYDGGNIFQVNSVAISVDGNTVVVGGGNNFDGPMIYARNGATWIKQTNLVGNDAAYSYQGANSVAMSADGNTVLVGIKESTDGGNTIGFATQVFVRNGSSWIQQAKLIGLGVIGTNGSVQGSAVSISADGNTAIIGGQGDNDARGAAWIFRRSGTTWAQEAKVVGSGELGTVTHQGWSVAISGDGNTAMLGGIGANGGTGAAWVFTRYNNMWSEQTKLKGAVSGEGANSPYQVGLNADGNTAVIGWANDNNDTGAAVIFTRNNTSWTQQAKLVGAASRPNPRIGPSEGCSVSISADGNTVLFGGFFDYNNYFNGGPQGAAWIFTRNGTTWTQRTKLMPTAAGFPSESLLGMSVALSADGTTALLGGPGNINVGGYITAAIFIAPSTLNVTLGSPADGSEISNSGATQFSWTGSSTDSAVPITYKFTLVEVTAGQTPANAIHTNKPIFEKDTLNMSHMEYPFTAMQPGFVAGSKYAWKVIAKQDGLNTVGGESEIRTFTIPEPLPVAAPNITYAGGTHTYATGTAITALTATNSGGAVPANIYGQVTTFAGSGVAGNTNGIGTAASFNLPSGIAVDVARNAYVADQRNNLLRKITPGGVVTTFPATTFSLPSAVAVDAAGNVYLAEGYTLIRKITPGGAVNTLAGSLLPGNTNGVGGAARFHNPAGLAVDAAGNVYVADDLNGLIRKITPDGVVTTLAGSGAHGSTDGTGTAASFSNPTGIAVDAAGNVYVADYGPGTLNNKIRKITPAGVVSTLAGDFSAPSGVAVDAVGNIYVADSGNNRIRKISPAGVLSTLAGDFYSGNTNDVGAAARFRSPYSVAVDAAGNVYVADLGNNLIRKITATGYSISPALPIGLVFDATTGTISGTPAEARAATNYTITAYNAVGSSTATLSLTVTTPANNSNLAGLAVSPGALAPVFAAGTLNYNVLVTNATDYITVKPTSANPNATIKVAGTTVASGTPVSLPLVLGANNIAVVVTSQDGSKVRTYNLTVTRQSNNANLAGLSIAEGTLSPAFSAGVTSYQAAVTTSFVIVKPTAANPHATIKVNGVDVSTGANSGSIPLGVGNNIISTVITSEDGTKERTYSITVNRIVVTTLANLSISSGTLMPAFSPGTTSYAVNVTNATTAVTLTPTTSDAAASVKVNGVPVVSGSGSASIALVNGANTINVTVTGNDGLSTRTYTVTVTRQSNNSNLANMTVSTGTLTPVFAAGTLDYTVLLPSTTQAIAVTPTAANPNATITVAGVMVASGTSSANIPLVLGPSYIGVIVTSQDGTKIRTYNLIVVRQSNNANLVALSLSAGTLTPAFSSATLSYTASVSSSVSSVKVTPKAQNGHASINVNGVPVVSGQASASLPLAVGNNMITTMVTSEDGTKTRSYTANIIREVAPGPLAASSSIIKATVPLMRDRSQSARDSYMAGPFVKQAVSPNGDGQNDVLLIDGIETYPDNKLIVMNRDGKSIFEMANYDNVSKTFDGRAGNTRKLQPAGTYFYQLLYKTADGSQKQKTGFFILKY
jgi:gliding motility-associated-like protein